VVLGGGGGAFLLSNRDELTCRICDSALPPKFQFCVKIRKIQYNEWQISGILVVFLVVSYPDCGFSVLFPQL
jgi:hypothetical protein